MASSTRIIWAVLGIALAVAILILLLAVIGNPGGVSRLVDDIRGIRIPMFLVGGVLLVAAGIVALFGVVSFREGYAAGLWLVAALAPGIAATAAVAVYIRVDAAEGATVLVLSLGVMAIAWTLGGLAARPLARRERAQLREFGALALRYRELQARLNAIAEPAAGDPAAAAYAEATNVLDEVEGELLGAAGSDPALRWALATGYTEVGRNLDRVAEALLIAQPATAVAGEALHEDLRLAGSTIANREQLRSYVLAATAVISPALAAQMPGGPGAASASPLSEPEARELLREVRHAVNVFRNDRIEGIVRHRNRLVWSLLTVAIISYLVLGLAILSGVAANLLVGASVFYLIGAGVGAFNRLRLDASKSSSIEDYGLSLIRLVVSAPISGLAALGGVALVALGPALLGVLGPTVDDVDAPSLSGQLGDAYDLSKNAVGVLVAAAFGLAPAQFTKALERQATRLVRDLESSEAATATPGPSEDGSEG